MRKRASGKARARKGGKKWVLLAAVFMAAAFLSGWWLLEGETGLKIRRVCLERLSILVDRVDELSEAWQSRKTARSDDLDSSRKIESPAPPAAHKEKKVLRKQEVVEPSDEITAEDQEELRQLLRNLNEQ